MDTPVVGAEDERALAAEAVDGDSLDADALDALRRIGEAVGPAGAALGEGDPLILPAGVLHDHGLRLLGPTDQLHVVLRHDDGALVAGVGRAGCARLVVRPRVDEDVVTRIRGIHGRLDRVAGTHADDGGAGG